MLYKKPDREKCVEAGAWHLYDPDQHPDHPSWQECLEKAEEGVTEGSREYTVFIDEDGVERQPPQI